VNAAFALSLALVLVALGVLLLGLAIVLRRFLRQRLDAARRRQIEPMRRPVLQMVAGDPEESAEAVAVLGALQGRGWRAVEPSVVALLSKVRGEAHAQVVELLVRQGTVDRARHATSSHDPVRRARAAHLLGLARQRGARLDLERLLRDRDEDVRRVSAAALGHLGDPRSTTVLLHTLAARRGVPASVVASAVAELGHWAHASLFNAIGDDSPMVRAVAIEICGLAGAVPASPVLRAALRHDTQVEVRVRAARALGRLGVPNAVPDLVAAAAPDQPAALRMVIARALGDIGSVEAVPGLRLMLDAPEHRVAANAAAALARIGGLGVSVLRDVAAGDTPAAREATAGLALVELAARAAQIAAAAHAPVMSR
jgi:HEAT repeat protein